MLIAMHRSHHWLPFWDEPRQPKELFEPKRHGNMKIVVAGHKLLARDTRLWPVLAGLHAVDMPVMAHVSAFRKRTGEDAYQYCHPLWVQVTTLSSEQNRRGFPLVLKDGKLMVEHQWAGNDEPGDPYQFLNREELLPDSVAHSPHFWTAFFIEKLSWVAARTPSEHDTEVPEVPTRRVMVPA